MPSQDFIDVRIISNGVPLVEYHDPEGNSDNENSHTRYVEARTDQSFAVQVTFLPGFDLEFAPMLYAEVYIDDADDYRFITFEKAKVKHHKGVLRQEKQHTFEWKLYKNDATGDWEKFLFKFGALGRSQHSA